MWQTAGGLPLVHTRGSATARRSYCAVTDKRLLVLVLSAICGAAVGAGQAPEGTAAYREGDFSRAERLLRPVAQNGDARAQLRMGHIVAQRDASEAAVWYRWAADQGLAAAEAQLAACYATGDGVPQSDVEAAKWYRLAAAQGDVQAAASLGYLYQFGDGIPRDDTEAVRWYRVAARGGDRLSQNMLGYFYTVGVGVAQSASHATQWYRRAAEQGDGKSQYELARAYYEGTGVSRDLLASYLWATVAMGHLEEKSEREATLRVLAAVSRDLSKSQIDEASRRAAQWHPAPGTAENYGSPDGTLRAVVVVTGAGGESRVDIRDGDGVLQTRRYDSATGQHGYVVQHAEWSDDSRFFVFSLASSGGHQPWHYPTFFYSRRGNKIEALDDYTGPVAGPDFHLSAPDGIRVMTLGMPEESGSPTEVRVRLGALPAAKR